MRRRSPSRPPACPSAPPSFQHRSSLNPAAGFRGPARPAPPDCRRRAFARGHQPNPVETRLQAPPVRRPPIALYSSHAPIFPATSDPNPTTGRRPAHRTMFRRGAKYECQVRVPNAGTRCLTERRTSPANDRLQPTVHPAPQTSYHNQVMNSFAKCAKRVNAGAFSVLIESEPGCGFFSRKSCPMPASTTGVITHAASPSLYMLRLAA